MTSKLSSKGRETDMYAAYQLEGPRLGGAGLGGATCTDQLSGPGTVERCNRASWRARPPTIAQAATAIRWHVRLPDRTSRREAERRLVLPPA